MTTPAPLTTPLRDPGDLIAAVPHLLGFHPCDSVVVVLVEGSAVAMTLRADLPPPQHTRRAVEQLLPALSRQAGATAVVVVVGGPRPDPPERLPREDLITHLGAAFDAVGIRLACAVWTQAAEKGTPWFDYWDLGSAGTTPDPRGTALAAASAAMGFVTYPSRDAMVQVLAPAPEQVLARRSEALDRLVAESQAVPPRDAARHGRALVHQAVTAAADRKTPLTDEEVVLLAHALSDPWVRDASLSYAVGEHAIGAERLWTELTRACPPPERAEPATLLAFSAYLRGEGALAAAALERAQQAHPGHRLATLLRTALESGIPPERIRELC
ncbi:DUF4192 domain-containing protein [Saccharothrix coeruleofusca]|uniref:DUF4192 domain-containing protein n=1 Tax=Saccharothrix coeruleofusca TaxID=33919 RepID=A0A918EBA3_9PSEU|nr:DUF4192 domain-containing protein [Saccharothrix coeruleofusca]GGP40662.1 hypothetical protein GCM10010185_09670 [Saccharothrix coeruleofusca]